MPRLYDELRRLASFKINRETPGQTLSGTDLLHEAFMRLYREGDAPKWSSERQFFSAAAEVMRRILIDRVRAKRRLKRGGEYTRIEIDEASISSPHSEERLLEVNEAIDHLEKEDPEAADLVKLRYFAGLTLKEIAESQKVSVRTLTRQWAYAKAWLVRHVEGS